MTSASCHDMKVFAEYMRTRFLNTGKKSAAVTAVSQFAKDAPLSEAVLLAIESLTTRESKELRRVVDQFHDYCEWHDTWKPLGWEARKDFGSTVLLASPPLGGALDDALRGLGVPSPQIIAAAVGVSSVKSTSDPWIQNDPMKDGRSVRRYYTRFVAKR